MCSQTLSHQLFHTGLSNCFITLILEKNVLLASSWPYHIKSAMLDCGKLLPYNVYFFASYATFSVGELCEWKQL